MVFQPSLWWVTDRVILQWCWQFVSYYKGSIAKRAVRYFFVSIPFQQRWTVYPSRQYVRLSVCASVCLSGNVRLNTANKLLELEEPILAHIYSLTRYLLQPVLIQIVNALDLHFQGKNLNRVHWEVHTWLSFRLRISRKRWQIGQTFLLPINRKSHVAFKIAYLYLLISISKCQDQGHAHFDCQYLAHSER